MVQADDNFNANETHASFLSSVLNSTTVLIRSENEAHIYINYKMGKSYQTSTSS